MKRTAVLLACLVLCILALSTAGCGNSALEQGLRAEKAGNLADALASYSAAINSTFMVSQKRSLAYANRGGVYLIQGKLDLALKDLNNALEQDAQSEAAYYNRAVVYLLKGEIKKAQGDAKRLLQLEPTNPAARRLFEMTQNPPPRLTIPLTWSQANAAR